MDRTKRYFIGILFLNFTATVLSYGSRSFSASLFLSVYPSDWLVYLYVVDSAVMVLFTLASNYFLGNHPHRQVLVSQGIAVGMLSVLSLIPAETTKWLPFVMCFSATCASYINAVNLWNLAGLIFTQRQLKKYGVTMGVVGTGTGILFGLVAPVYIHVFGSRALLQLCAIVLLLTLPVVYTAKPIVDKRPAKSAVGNQVVFAYPLYTTLFLLFFGAVCVNVLADFHLKGIMAAQMTENQIAQFLSYYLAVCSVIAIFIQAFVTPSLMKGFGVVGLLAVIPIACLITVIPVVVAPTLLWPAVLLIAAYDISNNAFRRLGSQLALNVLPGQVRARAKVHLKGIGGPAATILASSLIWVMTYLDVGGRVRAVGIILFCISMYWLLKPLKKLYQSMLKEALILKRFNDKQTLDAAEDARFYRDVVLSSLRAKDFSSNSIGLSLITPEAFKKLPEEVKALLSSDEREIRLLAARAIKKLDDVAGVKIIIERLPNEPDADVSCVLMDALHHLSPAASLTIARDYLEDNRAKVQAKAVRLEMLAGNVDDIIDAMNRLKNMIYAKTSGEKQAAAQIIGDLKIGDLSGELQSLLDDEDREVVIKAIYATQKLKDARFIKPLCVLLNRRDVLYHAEKVLIEFGGGALTDLSEFIEASHSPLAHMVAIKALSRIEGRKAEEELIHICEDKIAHGVLARNALPKYFANRAKEIGLSESGLAFCRKQALGEAKFIGSLYRIIHCEMDPTLREEVVVRQFLAQKRFLYWLASVSDTEQVILLMPSLEREDQNTNEYAHALELLETYLEDNALKQAVSQVFETNTKFDACVVERADLYFDPWLQRVYEYVHRESESEQVILETVFLLRQAEVFSELPAESLLSIAEQVTSRRLREGETLYSEGEKPGLYILTSGQMYLQQSGKTFMQVEPYEALALASLISQDNTVTCAQAKTDCSLLYIKRGDFQHILEDLPEVMRVATHIVVRYLQHAFAANVEFASKAVD